MDSGGAGEADPKTEERQAAVLDRYRGLLRDGQHAKASKLAEWTGASGSPADDDDFDRWYAGDDGDFDWWYGNEFDEEHQRN